MHAFFRETVQAGRSGGSALEAGRRGTCTSTRAGVAVTNEDERARFNFALFETTRLYAYGGSKVIVLPDKDEVATFPDAGEIAEQVNDFCDPPRPEMHSNWGFTKKMGYEHSGWCCAEFAIALRNGTIANVR